MYAATAGYPYFVQAYGKVGLGRRPAQPDHRRTTSRWRRPEAEAELAVGFFGSRFERATPAEREYLRAMADVARSSDGDDDPTRVPTADVAEHLGRKPQSLSPGPRRAHQEGPVY